MPINGFLYPGASGPPAPYEVANSLRFDDGSSDYMHITRGSAGNQKTFTISMWLKRSRIAGGSGDAVYFWTVGPDGNTNFVLVFDNDDQLEIWEYKSSAYQFRLKPSMRFRDPSAWYHLVVAFDTTQGTASNRVKVYVNGTQLTNFDTSSYPSQNYDTLMNDDRKYWLGKYTSLSYYYDGYICEMVVIDGQQLDPTSFGEFDSDSPNIWKPIDVSGLTFGTNGFYLDFEDSSALGNDANGGDDFTVVNLTSVDQSTDTCTNNFATWNNLLGIQIPDSFSEGNLKLTMSQNAWRTTFSTIASNSGKWYAEVKWVTGTEFTAGFGNAQSYSVDQDLNDLVANPGGDGFVSIIYKNGVLYENGSSSGSGYSTYSSGNIIMLAMDLDNYKLYLGVNGTWGNSANPATNTNGVAIPSANQGDFFHFAVSTYGTTQASANFGSPPYSITSGNSDANNYGNFEYAVPSGYYALNTKNLAEFG